MSLNQTGTLAALGVNFTQLLLLMRNSEFPTPLTNDGYGGVTFDSTAITNFAATMASAKSNGWQWTNADLPSFNFTMASTTPVGPYYRPASNFLLDV